MSRILFAAASVAFLALSGPAFAQDATGAPAPLAACKADADKLCAGADGRDRMKCLRDNAANLSADCKAGMEKMAALRKAADENCKADRASLCKDDGGDGRGGFRCLRENIAKVSKGCADAMAALPAWRGGEGKAKQ